MRETASSPITCLWMTKPPASRILCASSALAGVWSSLSWTHAKLWPGRGHWRNNIWRVAHIGAAHIVNMHLVLPETRVTRGRRISRRPPRHRRDACSMAWRCRFITAQLQAARPRKAEN